MNTYTFDYDLDFDLFATITESLDKSVVEIRTGKGRHGLVSTEIFTGQDHYLKVNNFLDDYVIIC